MGTFKTKSGDLTHYALACGYVQRVDCHNVLLTLWYEGGTVFHVRGHEIEGRGRLFWETFERLSDARKFYKAKAREFYGRQWRQFEGK